MTQTNEFRSFTTKFLIFGILAGIVGIVILMLTGKIDKLQVVILAWAVSFFVIFSGYLSNRWAFSRPHKVFFSILFGGMAFRIVLMLGIVLLVFFKEWVPIVWFLIILAVYYFLFQMVEVLVINRQLKQLKMNKDRMEIDDIT